MCTGHVQSMCTNLSSHTHTIGCAGHCLIAEHHIFFCVVLFFALHIYIVRVVVYVAFEIFVSFSRILQPLLLL